MQPMPESEPVQGLSLMVSALWGQAKRNPAQAIALLVGFLLALRVPYCNLYDLGYTSIGLQDDTIPNPRLRTVQGHYLPAHRLTEASEERLGRQRSPKL